MFTSGYFFTHEKKKHFTPVEVRSPGSKPVHFCNCLMCEILRKISFPDGNALPDCSHWKNDSQYRTRNNTIIEKYRNHGQLPVPVLTVSEFLGEITDQINYF